jgi:hypothetical protein
MLLSSHDVRIRAQLVLEVLRLNNYIHQVAICADDANVAALVDAGITNFFIGEQVYRVRDVM